MKNTLSLIKIRVYPNYWDIIALLFILTIVILFAWVGTQMSVPYHVGEIIPISLNPIHLPFYALCTTTRLLIAMGFSLLFTFTIGTWAAKGRLAGRVIIPVIDVLQSVPVLGFLSITVAMFIALFPSRLLGPEIAAIFAIFTAQAWNMVLGFYQSLRTVPQDFLAAADMFQLSAWQRFWRIEVPFAMPALLWNTMMSMSASWFFITVAESITVSQQEIALPGVGSYLAMAIQRADRVAILYVICTMIVVIFLYDQLLFRPLVAWGEKFKVEETMQGKYARSWLISLFQRTRILKLLRPVLARLSTQWVNITWFRGQREYYRGENRHPVLNFWLSTIFNFLLIFSIVAAAIILYQFIFNVVSLHEGLHVFYLGLVTAIRVLVLLALATLIWTPVGVFIGFRPRLTAIVQPLVQFLAAFPAVLLFPLVVSTIVTFHLNIEIWVAPLIILGAQWYLLFNVIAGASALPEDLKQVANNFNLSLRLRWRRLILPGIFPYYVTGAITAMGGAWNATIVAEVVHWGHKTLMATGLGSYIAQHTISGDMPRVALGIGVMSIYVLLLNRIVWRPLYLLARERFALN